MTPRDARLRRLYSISEADYDQILEYQGGICPLCEEYLTAKGMPKKFGTDHDHVTGLTRGVLCFLCNRKLGAVRDDIPWLQRTIKYLKDPPAITALGGARYGRKGRITNKRRKRRRVKI